MKTNSDFSDAKVGDLVTSLRYGHGWIIEVLVEAAYPIGVMFGDDIDEQYNDFTPDGREMDDDFAPTLFKGHIAIDSLQVTYNTLPNAS